MFRFILLLLLAALLFSLTGCASLHAPKQKPFAGLPFRHNGFDFKKAWKASPSSQGLVVEGVLKNIRYYRVENLDITVSLLRKGGAVVAKERTILGDVSMDNYRNFSLVLKEATVDPGDQLRFSFNYNFVDGGSSYGKWSSDFTADAVTGTPFRTEENVSQDE